MRAAVFATLPAWLLTAGASVSTLAGVDFTVLAEAVERGAGAAAAEVLSLDFDFLAGAGDSGVVDGGVDAGVVLPDVPVVVWALTTTLPTTVLDVEPEVSDELPDVVSDALGVLPAVADVPVSVVLPVDSEEVDAGPSPPAALAPEAVLPEAEALDALDELEVEVPVEVSSAAAMP